MSKTKKPILVANGGTVMPISGTLYGSPTWNSFLDRWEYPTPPKDSALRKQYKEVVGKYEEITRSGDEDYTAYIDWDSIVSCSGITLSGCI